MLEIIPNTKYNIDKPERRLRVCLKSNGFSENKKNLLSNTSHEQ